MAIKIDTFTVDKTSFSYKVSWDIPTASEINKDGNYGAGKTYPSVGYGEISYRLIKQKLIIATQTHQQISPEEVFSKDFGTDVKEYSGSNKYSIETVIPNNNLITWNFQPIIVFYRQKYKGDWRLIQESTRRSATTITNTPIPPKSIEIPSNEENRTSLTHRVKDGKPYYTGLSRPVGTQQDGTVIYEYLHAQDYIETIYEVEEKADGNPTTYGQDIVIKEFYPHPNTFTFNNCKKGEKWLVEKGINNSLITNLTNFQMYARQWKSWKEQKEAASPPSWDSPISAARLNKIYEYVDETTNYQKGDKISADMFNGLADIINTK